MLKPSNTDTAPKLSGALDHVRLQTATNWGALGGDTLIHNQGKFKLELTEQGVIVTLNGGEARAFIPMANIKFAVYSK